MADNTKHACHACRVGFPELEALRGHYKTEWHRYNLKRKVAGMGHVTAQAFRERVDAQKQEDVKKAQKVEKSESYCSVCAKKFKTENAFSNHIASKKHKDAVKAASESDVELDDENRQDRKVQLENRQPIEEQNRKYAAIQKQFEEEAKLEELKAQGLAPAAPSISLAPVQETSSADTNTDMDTSADPEVAEGSTEEGDTATSDKEKEKTVADEPVLELVDSMFDTYRAESFEANIKYMSEKHDFFIPNLEYVVDLEGLVRYLQLKVGNFFTCLRCNKAFYSLEAVRAHMDDKAHKAVDYSDDGQLELGEFYDFSSTYPDNDMITDEERDADLTMAVPTGVQVAYREGFELVLPSGKRAGHRDLQRYYRQRFKPEDTRDSVRIAKLVAEYRALGYTKSWTPSQTLRRDQAFEHRSRKSHSLDVGVKANKLQHHYREQVMQ